MNIPKSYEHSATLIRYRKAQSLRYSCLLAYQPDYFRNTGSTVWIPCVDDRILDAIPVLR
jgi:hypothetical protein